MFSSSFVFLNVFFCCECLFSWVGVFAVCCGWLMVVRACWMVVRACSFMYVDVIIFIVSGLCFFCGLFVFVCWCVHHHRASDQHSLRAHYISARGTGVVVRACWLVCMSMCVFFSLAVWCFLACLGVWRLACDAGWLDLRVLFCVACDVGVVCGCEWVGVFAVCVRGVCIVVWLLRVCVL